VDDEPCVVLLRIPLEACEVGLLELVVLLWVPLAMLYMGLTCLGQVRGKVGAPT
jgi:hypothetical protein